MSDEQTPQPEANENTKYTANLPHWRDEVARFMDTADAASPDAQHIAAAIRSGLVEIAIEVNQIRRNGIKS